MLTQLDWLKLGRNLIQRIENLDPLTNLQKLKLHSNQIRKIEGLNNLKKLKELDIAINPIKKLEGLENLENLEVLYLKNTQIPLEIIEKLGGYHPSNKVNDPKSFITYCKQLIKKNNDIFN